MRAVIVGLSLWAPAPAVAQYAPFHPPGGLAPATTVGGQTLAQMQAATSAAQAMASAAVPAVTIGQDGGVAGLDSGGRVMAPVGGDVTGAAVTPAGGAATTVGAYLGTLATTADLSAYLTATAAAQMYATQGALAATTATANAAVPVLEIGQPSGVAGLDASGQVTAPVVGDVTNAVATPAGGAQVTIGAVLASYAAQAGLVAETSRAEGAEATLQGNIAAEATTRADADTQLMPIAGGAFTGNVALSYIGSPAEFKIGMQNTAARFRERDDINNFSITTNINLNGDQDDTSMSSWEMAMGYGVANDSFRVGRIPPGSTSSGRLPVLLNLDHAGNLKLAGVAQTAGYTVSTLPGGSAGMRAYVTDAASCPFMGTLSGGGSTVCPVFHNGSAWVAE
ncbi:hypothetical protein AA13595_2878 [Gluconacetobacter johannae DSM 13595]|nr:hypothetical protein AA13595_2878 [Gluconacetobacter johannae DSM 13595]